MYFNSQFFLLVFLPVVLALYWSLARFFASGHKIFGLVLLLASWVFYGYWDIRLLPLLLASILVNFGLLKLIIKSRASARLTVIVGITLNLAVLGFFKYFNFFTEIASSLYGFDAQRFNIILPLAISFFTFQQISCLVDAANGKFTRYRLLDYMLFVSFFPQLVAGPIVRHNELIPQLAGLPDKKELEDKFARGLLLLTMGLAKKVFIADTLSGYANQIFDKSLTGPVFALDAWGAMFAFGFQIYFDFSGYSDMALGLALLFGITLPVNFRTPYKAGSLIDFWRRWHMTLSFFLRDYLYIPLGGSRNGLTRMFIALFVTMLLGGLWHGAGWTFIIWGVLHGGGLVINQAWRRTGIYTPVLAGWLLTFLFTMAAFLIFRAETMASALNIFSSGLVFSPHGKTWVNLFDGELVAAFVTAVVFALLLPEIHEMAKKAFWRNIVGGFVIGVLFVAIVIYLGGAAEQEFIYFQF